MKNIKRYTSYTILFIILLLFFGCQNQKYTITFNTNGGSEITPINLEYNKILTKPDDPINPGYTFIGWYTDNNLTKLYNFSSPIKKDLILYAKWSPNLYTIYFESNGGTNIKPITTPFNSEIQKPIDPIKTCYTFAGWYEDNELTKEFIFSKMPNKNITLYAKWLENKTDKNLLRVSVDESIQDAVDNLYDYYEEDNSFNLFPSKGDVNILVIPIEFPDDYFTNYELEIIENLFFGNNQDLESLKTFYYKSSYGNLLINGEILEPYTASKKARYYEYWTSPYNESASGVDLLIEEAITYYMNNNPDLDLSIYDTNEDGFLDAVHLVYSTDINYDDDDSIYWAFQYYYNATSGINDDDYLSWGEYDFDSYVFSGVDFFFENNTLNANTIIHETGHLLGLDDYYDYTQSLDSNIGGLGGADIMDYTVGDHNAFSKLILNWIDPIVVSNNLVITIDDFVSSGDAIIISNNFSTIFDEYFIISYYTPTSLNKTNQYLTENGLIMYHVNAVLPDDYDNLYEYSYYFKYNNSDSKYKLIKLEEADGNNDISKNGDYAENSDLLQNNESYTFKTYDNTTICTVTVLEIMENSITLSFHFVD